MLETEIKKLSSQIEQLNSNFEQFFSSTTQNAPIETPKVDDAQLELPLEEVEQSEEITQDALRDLCITKSREGHKKEVRVILTDLGAKVVDDLSEEGLTEAFKRIGEL